jgi:hypothetical protein
MIRKLNSGKYRLYSRKINPKTGKRRNLGTFGSRATAEQHEHAVQYFKRHGRNPSSPRENGGRGTTRSVLEGACEPTLRCRCRMIVESRAPSTALRAVPLPR